MTTHYEILGIPREASAELVKRSYRRLVKIHHPDRFPSVTYILRHQEIIHRFGRFPHRNAALGRATTPEEAEFLREPRSSF